MEIQDIMEFLKQQSVETDRKFAQLREELSAAKLVQTEVEGSVSPMSRDRRREDSLLQEPNFRHEIRAAALEKELHIGYSYCSNCVAYGTYSKNGEFIGYCANCAITVSRYLELESSCRDENSNLVRTPSGNRSIGVEEISLVTTATDKVTAVRSTANIDPEKIFDDLCNADIEERCNNANSDINKSGMNSYVKPYISNNFNNKN
jgi:hypothetical protein